MQCIETCSARKTYLELLDNPIGHIAFLHVGGGRIVSKRVKALVWFWIIDEILILTSILSVCRLNEVGTCQVMEQVMIMVMMVMTTR